MNKQRMDQKQRLILTVALLAAACGLAQLMGRWFFPPMEQFCAAASPWVLMGIGVAGILTLDGLKKGS